jgi:hypothetical protein
MGRIAEVIAQRGGEGSGNFGHGGRPGEVGGSSDEGGGGGKERFSSATAWRESLDKDQRNALQDWVSTRSTQLREADAGRGTKSDEKILNILKGSLKTSPLVESPIFRGIGVPVEARVGELFKQNAISSFTTKEKVAEAFSFGNGKGAGAFTILEVREHFGHPGISERSKGEAEVVVQKETSFVVTGIEKVTVLDWKNNSYEATKIILKEIK